MFVTDAATVLCWVIPGTMTPDAARALQRSRNTLLIVPSLWLWETHNALLKLVRQRKLVPEDATNARIAISLIPRRVDAMVDQLQVDRTWEIATTQMMTIYDATYVELALRLNLPIASDDTAIRNAARHLGLVLV